MKDLKVYKWEGAGHYLGAVIFQVAFNEEEAREAIEKRLFENGLIESWHASEELKEIPLTRGTLYFDNGDY